MAGEAFWLRMLVLLGIAVASSAALVWILAGDDDAPTLTAASSVSTGPKLVSVPDVVGIVPGWTEEQARAELERRGFRVRVVEDPTADAHAVGATLSQDPGAYEKVPAGTVVTIVMGG